MTESALVDDVVEVLEGWVTRKGGGRSGAAAVFDLVYGRLRRAGTVGFFEEFADRPTAVPVRARLVEVLEKQFREDPAFEKAIGDLVRAVRPPRLPRWRLFAVSLAAVVVAGGVIVYLSLDEPAPLDGGLSCQDFWVLTETEQRDLLSRLYRQRLQPRRAEEPTITASVRYACGQNSDRTIDQVLDES